MWFSVAIFFVMGLVHGFCEESLLLEEKIGQLLMVHFRGERSNEEAKILIQEVQVGSVIYYNWSNGLYSLEQVRALSEDLQTLARQNRHFIPLLIAIDQEGGRVSRLKKDKFPGHRELGEKKDPFFAEEVAFALGKQLSECGIHLNLAPVVDVGFQDRSFGDDPEIVTDFGRQFLQGLHRANVAGTLKHFPGYGGVTVDPHQDLPILDKSKEEWERIDLVPFAQLSSFADAIMTAHVFIPALDSKNCATLSKKTLSYLRNELRFEGVIISDSLVMEGVLCQCASVEEAALRALNAGCDLLILGGKLSRQGRDPVELTAKDVQKLHRFLVEAVNEGRISQGRIDEALRRVFHLKGLSNKRAPMVDWGATEK